MIQISLKKRIFNHVYYPHLRDYRKRYEVYYGGAGSGKSVFIAQKLIYKALQSQRKVLVLRKVNSTTKNSTFSLLLKTLSDWKLISFCKVNKSDFTITLPNNSTFLCMGLDDPEKLKSITGITDAWMEEATEFTQDDFNQVDLRIREPVDNSQLIRSFNPVSKANWCYLNFFKPNPELDEFRSNCEIVQTTYKDNRFLPDNYIKSLKLMMATNPVYFKIYAEGEFGSLDKLIYNNWQSYEFDHTKVKGKLCVGLDFGYVNDPTAIVASIVDEQEKRIYIFKEMVEEGLLNDAIGQKIIDMGFKKSDIVADSAE